MCVCVYRNQMGKYLSIRVQTFLPLWGALLLNTITVHVQFSVRYSGAIGFETLLDQIFSFKCGCV